MTPSARAETPETAVQPSEPIATRQTIFSIPFQVEKAQHASQEPVAVHLYVSTDRGANWRPYARVQPTQGYFLFRAVGDGQYWFLVRTLDHTGQLRPAGPIRPGLRVIVDTTPPTLQLEASRGEAGQIIAQWKIGELAPKPDSLKIQYRTDTDPTWQSVAVDASHVDKDGPMQTGKVVWWPPAAAGQLQIRAEVTDLAGNAAVSHQQVGAGPVPQTPDGPQLKDPNADKTAAQGWRPAVRKDKPDAERADANWLAKAAPDAPSDDPTVRPAPASQHPQVARGGTAAVLPPAGSPNNQAPGGQWPTITGPPAGSVAGNVNPPIQNQYFVPSAQEPPKEPQAPAAAPPRMVNSRVFELEYEQSAAAGGQTGGHVELWGTRDGGRTWQRFGDDADGRSPVLVTVSEEGLYGFRVVARANPQDPSVQPAAGEQPDAWIGVDLSSPRAVIVSAQPEAATGAGQLVIRWEAADQKLAAAPVSLFYRDETGAGWSTIASGLENTGMYAWRFDGPIAKQVYLRLEVRDAAGNLAVYEAPQPIRTRAPDATVPMNDAVSPSQASRPLSAYRAVR